MGSESSRPSPEESEEWEDHFHHEYQQPGEATWPEDEQQGDSSVSIQLGPRLVKRLLQRSHPGSGVPRPHRAEPPTRVHKEEDEEVSLTVGGLFLDPDTTPLPPPLSDEELDSIGFSMPIVLVPDQDDEQVDHRHPRHLDLSTAQADREFAQREVADLRQQFQAEQERRAAADAEQIHKLRALLDEMSRHRREMSGGTCEAERDACLECYAKEKDNTLACASKARAFRQCATQRERATPS